MLCFMKYVFVFTLVFASCTPSKKASETMSFASNPVIAHRGAFRKNNYPENSIAALKEAIRLKCTGSEFDIRMSVDDTPLINHDPQYHGHDIEKTSYRDLSQIKLSNGEVLPTLRQFLLAGLENNRSTRLVVEIKPSASKERGKIIAEKVVQLVSQLNARSMVVYISFDYDILKKVHELDPQASTQYLNGELPPDQVKADGINGLDYHISVFRLHPEWVDSAHKLGLILNAWTVNSETDMRWLIERKFRFITTNEPELLLGIYKE